MLLPKRDVILISPDDRDRMSWWYSPTAYVVKWTVVLSLFLLFFLWITLGYLHARRRIRQGLKPLGYHRWLVPRSQRDQVQRTSGAYGYYRPGAYGMQDQRMDPPPVYNSDMPPSYQPPPGGSKILPFQDNAREVQAPAPAYTRNESASEIPQQQTGTIRP